MRTRDRILLIDDDPTLVDAVALVLDAYDIVAVPDAEAALELLGSDSHFDLVLCDIELPALGGIALYDVVSRHVPWLAERFIFVAGWLPTAEARAFARAHRTRLLEKPFEPETLRRTVAAFLGERARGRSSRV